MEINLQPTDRCVLDFSEYPIEQITITQNVVGISGSNGVGILSPDGRDFITVYESSRITIEFTKGKIVDVKGKYNTLINGTFISKTTIISFTDNSITYVVAGPTANTSIRNASIDIAYYPQDKKEVFKIQDENSNLIWVKKKPIKFSFNVFEVNSVTFKDLHENLHTIISPNTQYISAGDHWHSFEINLNPDYDIYSGGTIDSIDLSNIGNLTLEDFNQKTISIVCVIKGDTEIIDVSGRTASFAESAGGGLVSYYKASISGTTLKKIKSIAIVSSSNVNDYVKITNNGYGYICYLYHVKANASVTATLSITYES